MRPSKTWTAVRTRFNLTPKRYAAAALPIELQEPPVPQDYTETAAYIEAIKTHFPKMPKRKRKAFIDRTIIIENQGTYQDVVEGWIAQTE